jgi:hypothetical protein
MPTLFRDWFRDRPIEVPAELLAAGYVDAAWHNDAAPKMIFRTSETAEILVTAWIGDEFSQEETGGSRYYLEVGPCDSDGAWVENYDNERALIYGADDLAEMIRLALETAERLKAGAKVSDFPSISG